MTLYGNNLRGYWHGLIIEEYVVGPKVIVVANIETVAIFTTK